jgi:hypothetical protein
MEPIFSGYRIYKHLGRASTKTVGKDHAYTEIKFICDLLLVLVLQVAFNLFNLLLFYLKMSFQYITVLSARAIGTILEYTTQVHGRWNFIKNLCFKITLSVTYKLQFEQHGV